MTDGLEDVRGASFEIYVTSWDAANPAALAFRFGPPDHVSYFDSKKGLTGQLG